MTALTGFTILHANRAEMLRDVILAWLARDPLSSPLDDEVFLVQSQGMAQWLKHALAESPAGIAAALDFQLPQGFLWRCYRAVLGEDNVPAQSPFDKAPLSWRLYRELPAWLHEPVFAPLARFVEADADPRRLYQLAHQLADLYDQYQSYRADWLAGWEN
ncbi:MAG: exodeoxyribonuclease V subunit gamma, partial [Laribacter sp.]|nr:exodeoxyribonuclease V subunit gamma [Laribacter sp.]